MKEILLIGYTRKGHTNWYPWYKFDEVFETLGYEHRWLEWVNIPKSDNPRIFICWNEPNAYEIVQHTNFDKDKDIIIQKLTSLGKYDIAVNWGDHPREFFKTWNWPLYQMFEDLYDKGYNIYAFGCKTTSEGFPEKQRIVNKLQNRINWIPWGSSLFTLDEVKNCKPIISGFKQDLGFVGSVWGRLGRGNIESWRDYMQPLLNGRTASIAGSGTSRGAVGDEEHKAILQTSRLCPIINAASWRVEKGIQDRFWTVFTAGRFGVADTEGVLDFFNKDEVVYATETQEYIDKSIYFLNNLEAQVPYIEKIQKRIKIEYNYYHTWKNIIERIK